MYMVHTIENKSVCYTAYKVNSNKIVNKTAKTRETTNPSMSFVTHSFNSTCIFSVV